MKDEERVFDEVPFADLGLRGPPGNEIDHGRARTFSMSARITRTAASRR